MDYDYNTEYGDGDIPDIDKPRNVKSNSSDATDEIQEEVSTKNKSSDK
jgi:hypothetical protein